MIHDYNRIDVNTDTKTIIQAKINTMKLELSLGNMTEQEYLNEKSRVENEMSNYNVNCKFSW
jgi:hypothetical protein